MGKGELVDWTLNGEPLLEKPKNAKAIIYKITHIPSGRYYIGYKLFVNRVTTKLGKKALSLRTDKRTSTKKTVLKEKWMEYCGSCTDPEYKNLWKTEPENFKREILQIVNRGELSEKYYEAKWLILHDWESELCFNGNFLGKYFKRKQI